MIARIAVVAGLLYGSDPKLFAPIVQQMGIPEGRLAKCTKDYADRRDAWKKLLEPYRRLPAKK